LLDNFLRSIGLEREEIFITNVVKCRPPQNRQPTDEEIKKCFPFLEKQLEIIQPKLIICVGYIAAFSVFSKFGIEFSSMNKQHGKIYSINNLKYTLKIVATYHPAAILRNPNLMPLAKEDWEKIKEVI